MAEKSEDQMNIEFAKRALKAKWFKWFPGMQYLVQVNGDWSSDHPRLCDKRPDGMKVPKGAIPDVSDPATRGCIRQATGKDCGVEIFALSLEGLL